MRACHCNSAPCYFAVHGSSAGGDILCLICHVTLHDHLIERPCKFMGVSSLQHVTTLIKWRYKVNNILLDKST